MNLDEKALADVVAKLPPPWNADVVSVMWDARSNNALVEYFDHKPLPPSRWTQEEDEDEDSDGNWYTICEARKKTLAEFKREVARYREALAAWEARRSAGNPIQIRGYVSSGPPQITVRVTRKDGSSARIVGDGEAWKVVETRHVF